MARKLLLALLISALALFAAAPSIGYAQGAPGVVLRAEIGFDGKAREGRWTPVIVEIENRGVSNIEGELWVGENDAFGGSSTHYVEEVVLPAGGRKRFTVYAMAPSVSQEKEALLVVRGRTIASTTARATVLAEEDVFAGVIGSRAGAYNLLATLDLPDASRETVVVSVAPDALPAQPEALRAFDILVLAGPLDGPLAPGWGTTLEAWVADGGTLVLPAGSRDLDITVLPPALLPARPTGTRLVGSTEAFEQLAGEALPQNAPVSLAESGAVTGRVVAEQDGAPIAVLGRFGNGRVLYLAFDPAAQPFTAWSGTKRVWEELLIPALPPLTVRPSTLSYTGPSSQNSPSTQWTQTLYYAVTSLPSVEMPSVNFLLGIIGGYVLLVGPLNYFVLHRLRRATLAWATVPIIVLVFSTGTYTLAWESKGSDVRVSAVNMFRWAGDTEWARADRFVGVFVPREGDYAIGMPGEGLLAPMIPGGSRSSAGPRNYPGMPTMDAYVRTSEAGSRAELRGVGKWTMQTLWGESVERVPQRLAAKLYIEGDRLKGTVTNGTGIDLEALWVGTGAGAANLGTLAAGAEAQVNVALADTAGNLAGNLTNQVQRYPYPGSGSGSGVEQRRWQAASQAVRGAIEASYEQTLDGAPALLVGWGVQGQVGVTVDGENASGETLTVMVQPVLPEIRGQVTIPGGLVGARVHRVAMDASGNAQHQIIYASDNSSSGSGFREGDVAYQFELPWPTLGIERLAAQVPFDGAPPQGVKLQIMRWQSGDWETLSTTAVSIQPGVSGSGYPQGVFYGRGVPPPGPPQPAGMLPPAPTPAIARYPGQPYGRVTVVVTEGVSTFNTFTQALEGEATGNPAGYVSPSGQVLVRLVVDEGAGASQPVMLGTPALALKGTAHGS